MDNKIFMKKGLFFRKNYGIILFSKIRCCKAYRPIFITQYIFVVK